MYDYIRYDSPLGMLTVAAENGALTALVIDGQKYAELHLDGEGHELARESCEKESKILYSAVEWLDAYFNGKDPAGNPDVPYLTLQPKGTPFQMAVWQELQRIPYGKTETYGAIAKRLGTSARAVGTAAGRNPLSIIVPCHRVLGADGSLTGYAGGSENKKKLLRLEGILI